MVIAFKYALYYRVLQAG